MPDPSTQLFSVAVGSSEPIYRQLIEQVTRLVASGNLQSGQTLPSVRDMANALAVNPMTISKAYSMLEANGVLERQRGIGMVIAHHKNNIQKIQHRVELLNPTMEKLIFEANQLELDADTVITQLTILLKGSK
ncbi:GntR family transcriptional regulator [Solimicrobium silvestre]|uniref:Putative transcriptional regulator n=1 Tax=Solimicrobium silvestre TaxID=2099400 RepID=A0A2S9GYP0_9BURK|nr:GntR family transcriptional regulator [Solimicrobium silvestre]PRC92842.1 putative transcriptional regulator [Solimicrobium silvestre]